MSETDTMPQPGQRVSIEGPTKTLIGLVTKTFDYQGSFLLEVKAADESQPPVEYYVRLSDWRDPWWDTKESRKSVGKKGG